MKKTILTLLSLGAFSISLVSARADAPVKLLVVDMANIFDNHYETQAEKVKLDDANKKAQDSLDNINKEGNTLVAQYKELAEQAKNPAATSEAKTKAAESAQKIGQQIQQKMQDRDSFANNARGTIQQRIQSFRATMMESISKVVVTVAKRHDATLVIDKSGPSLLGISPIIYTDASYDITKEVIDEINKNKPANMPAAVPVPEGTSAAAPASEATPKITVPGVTQ
jgi:outer membrane protein